MPLLSNNLSGKSLSTALSAKTLLKHFTEEIFNPMYPNCCFLLHFYDAIFCEKWKKFLKRLLQRRFRALRPRNSSPFLVEKIRSLVKKVLHFQFGIYSIRFATFAFFIFFFILHPEKTQFQKKFKIFFISKIVDLNVK